MSYDKDKQAWYDKERRHKLALAIIEKMEKTDRDDFNLIPALSQYVETGDIKMFEEFKQFHDIKDLEEKARYIAERTESAKERIASNEESAKENASYFLITDEVFKDYKKEIGRAYYRQLTEQYGEINLRASFQFNKLFYYLTSTNIQQSTEGDHKHTEVKYTEDGSMIDFRIVKYTIEEKADNK